MSKSAALILVLVLWMLNGVEAPGRGIELPQKGSALSANVVRVVHVTEQEDRQYSGKDNQPKCKEGDRVIRRSLPEGFALFTFGIFVLVFICGLLICRHYDLLTLDPYNNDQQNK